MKNAFLIRFVGVFFGLIILRGYIKMLRQNNAITNFIGNIDKKAFRTESKFNHLNIECKIYCMFTL